MKYVDVVLPLPLEDRFTYSVPSSFESVVVPGMRVTVDFRRKKTMALVAAVHETKPPFECKDILDVPDIVPVVTPQQFRLWQWIADYYMAPFGEVYNVALPGGLKAPGVYRPKTETCLALAPEYRDGRALRVAMEILKRAKAQAKAFAVFLELSHNDTLITDGAAAGTSVEITRDELMNSAHCTAAVVKSLVDRKLLVTYEREVGRLNCDTQPCLENIKRLNEAQQDAYNRILMSFMKKNVVLLHGVTSSGKTEIYIHLIKQAMEQHRQVLYLLPEIALTVQIRERLQRVFGNRLGIYHSKYSDAERVEIWKKQLSDNPYDVILGARSAVFLPFTRLGLVIVDEEHETSFKQQDPAPRYHARSVAIMLAQACGAKTLLGTATPSAETYHNATTGKYGLVTLNRRYKDIQLPEIRVVDIRDMQRRKMMNGPFSPVLVKSVREVLEGGGQAILFQNRRGFAPMMECKVCGWVPRCTNCDVSLTYHKNMNQLTCHYCGYTYKLPEACPCCGNTDLKGRGYGTEKIEDKVMEVFPEARVARMDLDTTRTRTAYERIISDFSAGRTNLLIGTQMISKGLDFGGVGVVGILNADSMLNYPDFRAYEHAFTMMSQVAGRAGRKGRRGLVILQTKSPELPVISHVVHNNTSAFYAGLFEERSLFCYPPFYNVIYIFLNHRDENRVSTAAHELGNRLRSLLGNRVLGPDRPAVAKVKTMNIRKIVLKLEKTIDMGKVRRCLRSEIGRLESDTRYNSLKVYCDVDPL
ncbi:primosomal protein N' [Prevotella sp. PCHR]|uniref:Replication restart protein PriA n=1 Tax=Xylanibacter caecicola TaxID=2736294 RepID=A0ABX2B3Q8_9BACT|nr:primosomal protein N' [Xylanibacter caecicola]NPE24870.1 primosomal protein N' [Xylanibacter caecicola]